jgi:hypothetical protein
MLRRLPLDMLRAVLAHELGHVQLGHLDARRRRGPTPAIFRPPAPAGCPPIHPLTAARRRRWPAAIAAEPARGA